jgi:AraC-like DNA-binding protein
MYVFQVVEPPRERTHLFRPVDWRPPDLPESHGLLSHVVAHAFDDLEVTVSIWVKKDHWYAFHSVPNVTAFEYEHGAASGRWAYNDRCIRKACRERTAVLGSHYGFHDLFVPLEDASGTPRVLVAGPLATQRPTGADISQRWLEMSGTHARLGDAAFSRYLTVTLGTLTLEGSLLQVFERLMFCYSDLLLGRGDAPALGAEAEALRRRLSVARLPERMWRVATKLIDERVMHASLPLAMDDMAALGVSKLPEHAVVGLLVGDPKESDPVDAAVRRDAFMRGCVGLARKTGDVLCGKLGDHGVVFLVNTPAARLRSKAALTDLAQRAAQLAKRMHLKLCVGISLERHESLPARYRSALYAAEQALTDGRSLAYGAPGFASLSDRLRELRRELGRNLDRKPETLAARFDHYIAAVLAHTAYRFEATKAELDSGLERLAEPLVAAGFLEPRTLSEWWTALEIATESARTVGELLSVYRRLVSDIEQALANPPLARRDRATRRALAFMRDHLSEPLSLGRVARAAGFAPDYFSRLFKRTEGQTFAHYLTTLRLGRAEQLLELTDLTVDQVQRLCGFRTRTHFHRVFKQHFGKTPLQYRASAS